MPKPRHAALLAVAVTLAVAAAPAARADSISYVKDDNVWLSTPDGGRQFQVTADGGYSDASQADDGTIVALRGVRLRKLDRFGHVLADFATPVSDTRPPGQRFFFGPYDPAISPDGTKVAYTYYATTISQDPGCFPPLCVTHESDEGIGYTYSDRLTGWDEPGLGRQSGWIHPAWFDNSEVLLSDPARVLNEDVITDRVGDGNQTITRWFTDTNADEMDAGDVTRQRTKLAFVVGHDEERLRVYGMRGNAPALPVGACYELSGPVGGHFASPTFSPDGTRLAYAVGNGVWIAAVPDFSAGCTMDGATGGSLVIPGAAEPDWGPADVPAGRPTSGGGGSGKPGAGKPGGKPGAGATLAVARVRLARALSRGLVVRVSGSTAKVKLVARQGGRVVARGVGRRTVRLRFTAPARKRLRHAAKARLTVTGAGAKVKLTLRR